ncbi:MAG: hypothetical protein G8345_22170 [Magnetococcales bacterium]|nr:hypothetical protein [Magnetococcales bacterium]NGZ29582.1 hypothetical protein [Magnetococcales bacterium]
MGAIFGLLQWSGRPVDAVVGEQAMRAAAPFGREGVQLWFGGEIVLGRAVNLVRGRATHEATGLPLGLRHLRGVATVRLDNRPTLLARFNLAETTPDITLILMAYATWGDSCPEHLVGDFAFAIWDEQARRLFCARDRTGLRPFFYHHGNDYFAFASTLPILATLSSGERALDVHVWAAHFAHRLYSPQASHWKHVKRLSQACSLSVEAGKLHPHQYWRMRPRHPGCKTEEEWAEAGREILTTVMARQGADCPVAGLLLSGGLDSSLLLALLAKHRGIDSLIGVASVLPVDHQGPEQDERPQQNILRRHFPGLRIEEIVFAGINPLDEEIWKGLWGILGRPANMFHLTDHKLYARLSDQGARVVYCGLWGDAGFSYQGKGWAKPLAERGEWLQIVRMARLLSMRHGHSLAKELLRELRAALPKIAHSPRPQGMASLLNPDLQINLPPVTHGVATGVPRLALPEIMQGSLPSYEEQALAAASHGMEYVCPYVSPEMMEFILAIPPEVYVAKGWRRGLCRLAMEGLLPDEIRFRTDKKLYLPTFSTALRRHFPEYRQTFIQTLENVQKRNQLATYMDLDRLNALFSHEGPAEIAVIPDAELNQVAAVVLFLRFLNWQQGVVR